MSGVLADSAPPTLAMSLTVRDWNRRFANPAMRMAMIGEWFERLRGAIGSDVPVYRSHWPDHWAHGLGSAADEIRYARETQHLLAAAGIAASYVGRTDRTWGFPAAELGEIYHQGQSVPQSRVKAYVWYQRAAAQDFPPARIKLTELTQQMSNRELKEARRTHAGLAGG